MVFLPFFACFFGTLAFFGKKAFLEGLDKH